MTAMPYGYHDPNTATTVRLAAYLHGGGSGDAGLQITTEAELTGRFETLRMPGPVAEAWLLQALAALREARAAARINPWGTDG